MEKAYLCPPGNGVFTVNTARERKNQLHQTLYGREGDAVQAQWEESLGKLSSYRGSVLLGVCSDCGGGILRGANWGPLFVRNKLYSTKSRPEVFDLGDIRVIPHLLMDKYLNQGTIDTCRQALYGNSERELAVGPLSITMEVVEEFYQRFGDKGLLGLGGDHSVSFPLVRPYLNRRRAQGRTVGLIHFDAHTDIMESRLGIDICFGSWVYHILGDLPSPGHIYQIGLRSSRYDKQYWEKNFKVQQFWSGEVKRRGANDIAGEILEDLEKKQVDELYVSFDIDAIDAVYASATGTPEPDGLKPEEAMTILQKLEQNFPIAAADMVEVAPFIRHSEYSHSAEPEATLDITESFVQFFISAMNRFYRS